MFQDEGLAYAEELGSKEHRLPPHIFAQTNIYTHILLFSCYSMVLNLGQPSNHQDNAVK